MTLELYHHGSSACAAKVRFALAEKRLEWASHYVDILAGEQFKPEFLAINPKAVVPVLVHDGAVVVESTVICEYVEESFADNPIYPRSPLERAQVRVWTKAVDEELHPACSAITYVVSHRHTILRQGVGSFEEFLARGTHEGTAARTLKWQWIQQGIDAPGAAPRSDSTMRTCTRWSTRCATRNGSSAIDSRWPTSRWRRTSTESPLSRCTASGPRRLSCVERWFERVRDRPTFAPAFVEWLPQALAAEMRSNGERSWPEIKALLDIR